MRNVISLRPLRPGGTEDALPAARDYFALVDQHGRERPIMADSIEKALCEAESLECLGFADKQNQTHAQLRLVGKTS